MPPSIQPCSGLHSGEEMIGSSRTARPGSLRSAKAAQRSTSAWVPRRYAQSSSTGAPAKSSGTCTVSPESAVPATDGKRRPTIPCAPVNGGLPRPRAGDGRDAPVGHGRHHLAPGRRPEGGEVSGARDLVGRRGSGVSAGTPRGAQVAAVAQAAQPVAAVPEIDDDR